MSKVKALPKKATSKKVAPSKKLEAKVRAVNQKIEDERIAALRVEQKRTEINREASKVIHRYRKTLATTISKALSINYTVY